LTYHVPANNIFPDILALDLTVNGCLLDNASGLESPASLGTSGTTIDPSLLTVYGGFNELEDGLPYIRDVLGAGTTE
jgi:hypothetical protein